MKFSGQALARARDEAKMNQRELADKAGLSKFTVNRLEHGHHKPELDTIVALATALGITMDELLVSNGDKR